MDPTYQCVQSFSGDSDMQPRMRIPTMSPTREGPSRNTKAGGLVCAQTVGNLPAAQLNRCVSWAFLFRRKNVHVPCLRPSLVLEPNSAFLRPQFQNQIPESGQAEGEKRPLQSARRLVVFGLSGGENQGYGPAPKIRHISFGRPFHRRTGGT